jgi:hypothetical protein
MPAALHDLKEQIAGNLEELLLASIRVSKRRIIEMKEIAPLKQLLEAGFESRKKELSARLEAIQWNISSRPALRAVIRNYEIENVCGHGLTFVMRGLD